MWFNILLKKIRQMFVYPLRKSIRTRLILTMTIIAVLPTVIVTMLAADNSSRSMSETVVNTNLSNMKWTGIYLDQQFAQLNSLMYSLMIHANTASYLESNEEEGIASQYNAQLEITKLMSNIFYSAGNYMIGVELYTKEKERLVTFNSNGSDIKVMKEKPPYFNMFITSNKDFIISKYENDSSKFRMMRSINRFEDRSKLGYISFDIRWSILDQTLNLLSQGVDHTIALLDGDGQLLYQPAGEEIADTTWKKIKELHGGPNVVETEEEYIFYNTNESIQLTLVKVIPKTYVNQSATKTTKYGAIVGIISVLASIIIAIFLGWKISSPIVQLARTLRGLDFITKIDRYERKRIDEIGLLENKLYQLQSRIQEHIKTEYSMKLDKKTAELKALQAQINPHFLQNTMQMIGSMIYTRTADESYAVIRALSEMFRYVIREPDTLAILSNEMNHLNHYMYIQQQRFKEKIKYVVHIEGENQQIRLPKLTLQPIVENAFFHGLEAKPDQWKITITLRCYETYALIMVEDNGVGIEADKLVLLQKRLQRADNELWENGNRIGLSNIASRIKMRFGKQYGLSIASERGKGTIVTVKVPLQVRE